MIAVNGAVPLKISPRPTRGSFSVLLITYTDKPNGGVSNPISTATTVTTPNQIRLSWNVSAIGSISGRQISMMDDESMIVPSSRTMKT